jgi:hypothetical protein
VVRRNLELLRALTPAVPGHVQRLRGAYEAEVASSADAREAVLSFAEKRAPVWQDDLGREWTCRSDSIPPDRSWLSPSTGRRR